MTRALCLILAMTLLSACHDRAPSDPIVLDGSSTAFPLAEAVAHEFMKANKGTGVTVTFSGTGTGFVKFCRAAGYRQRVQADHSRRAEGV